MPTPRVALGAGDPGGSQPIEFIGVIPSLCALMLTRCTDMRFKFKPASNDILVVEALARALTSLARVCAWGTRGRPFPELKCATLPDLRAPHARPLILPSTARAIDPGGPTPGQPQRHCTPELRDDPPPNAAPPRRRAAPTKRTARANHGARANIGAARALLAPTPERPPRCCPLLRAAAGQLTPADEAPRRRRARPKGRCHRHPSTQCRAPTARAAITSRGPALPARAPNRLGTATTALSHRPDTPYRSATPPLGHYGRPPPPAHTPTGAGFYNSSNHADFR